MGIEELWEDYARKFNLLSNLMQKAGLDPKLLVNVIKAAVDLRNST